MSALAGAVALWLLAKPALPLRPHFPPARGEEVHEGVVLYVTAKGAFLDRGQAEGLSAGDQLKLFRGGRAVGSCVVESVADHSARCAASRAMAGDSFRVKGRPVVEPKRPARPLSAQELSARLETLSRHPLEKVPYTEVPHRPARRAKRIEVSLTHASWTTGGNPAAAFHRESLNGAIHGLELLGGVRLWLDASLHFWSARPAAFRDPVRTRAQLVVREAALKLSGPERPYRLALGRVWAEDAPGLALLDGLQGGIRPVKDLEVGAFAGLLPEPFSATPSTQRWTAGVYEAWQLRGGPFSLLAQQLRLGLVASPNTHLELEAAAQAYTAFGLDVEAAARAGLAAGKVSLDGARLGLGFRAAERLSLRASGRYVGALATDVLQTFPLAGVHGLHADLSGSYRLLDGVWVTLLGGMSRDFDSQLGRFWGGPEVSLPNLLGSGGVSLGWMEEVGFWGRRAVYGGVSYRPVTLLRASWRVTYTEDTPSVGSGDYPATEVGTCLSLDAALPYGLSATASGWIRHGLGSGFLAGETALRRSASTAYLVTAGVGAAF